MRFPIVLLCAATLGGCAAPAPQRATSAPVTAAFTVPMDPGTISCAALDNPRARDAATQWALGRARAATLAGRIDTVPDAAVLSENLASYCAANATETVGAAAVNIGL